MCLRRLLSCWCPILGLLRSDACRKPGGFVGQAVLEKRCDVEDRSRESVLSRRDQVMVAWQFTARGCKKPNPSPVGNGMIGWEGTFLNLEWRTYPRINSNRALRDGSFCKPIPGSKLLGYLHLVPPGRNPGHLATFFTPPPCFIRVLGSQEANGGNTLVLHSHITREAHALGTNRGRGRR